MVLTLNSADSITVKNWFDGTIFDKIENVDFADGTVWTAADMEFGLTVTGGGTVQGGQYADTLRANAYGAQLNGGGGDDQLVAMVDGSIFDVTFNGGAGNDILTGSYGRDIYQFNLGDGHDTITDDVRANGQGVADYFAANPTTDTYQDRIEFGAGITAQGVSRSRVGNDLVLTLNANDSIKVKNWFDGTVFNKIEKVVFADGTQWTSAFMEQAITVVGTTGADNLVGSAGADTLIGKLGDDTLAGGAGSDTYKFTRGDGHDTVVEDDSIAATDVALFDGGIASSQLWF